MPTRWNHAYALDSVTLGILLNEHPGLRYFHCTRISPASQMNVQRNTPRLSGLSLYNLDKGKNSSWQYSTLAMSLGSLESLLLGIEDEIASSYAAGQPLDNDAIQIRSLRACLQTNQNERTSRQALAKLRNLVFIGIDVIALFDGIQQQALDTSRLRSLVLHSCPDLQVILDLLQRADWHSLKKLP